MLDLPPPDPGIEIVLATRGYSKGLRQTEGVQGIGKFELAFGPVAFSTQYKNITSATAEGEFSFGAGWKGKVAGFDLGAAVNYKRLVELDGQVDPDCLEFIPSISRKFGPLTARASVTWTPDDTGSTGKSAWMEAGASWKLDGKTSVSANIGRRERTGSSDYTGFNAGVTRTLFDGVTADIRYYDTAESALGENFESRIVGALRARF